jgi:UDP-N-acetyl-D-glucosamine dehydrogenase
MPLYVVTRVQDLLNERERSLKGARILVLGVAYKPDISDLRESPALPLIDILRAKGALVSYADPYIEELHLGDDEVMRGVQLDGEALSAADCVLVVTPHTAVDYGWVAAKAGLVFDTRNVVPTAGPHVHRL